MYSLSTILFGIFVPFIGTAIGSLSVFIFTRGMPARLEKSLLGFAAGVMIAASVWSLLIPAIELSEGGALPAFCPALIGLLSGIAFLLFLDLAVPHLHIGSAQPEGPKRGLSRSAMLIFAVTLHNLPEGMAVGAVLSGTVGENPSIAASEAVLLALGIAFQNLPEGAIISMPLAGGGMRPRRAAALGILSGICEPVGAVTMLFLFSQLGTALPYFLAFAAGAMLYVVVEDLIPESQSGEHSNYATLSVAFGFALMMVLDVAFG